MTDSDFTFNKYCSVTNDLNKTYETFPRKCGLPSSEYWSLVMINDGARTQYEIANSLSLSPQTVNTAFRALTRKGLVSLVTRQNNLRIKEISLTDAGKDFVKTYVDTEYEIEEKAWNMLSPEERKQLIELTSKYHLILKAEIANQKYK